MCVKGHFLPNENCSDLLIPRGEYLYNKVGFSMSAQAAANIGLP